MPVASDVGSFLGGAFFFVCSALETDLPRLDPATALVNFVMGPGCETPSGLTCDGCRKEGNAVQPEAATQLKAATLKIKALFVYTTGLLAGSLKPFRPGMAPAVLLKLSRRSTDAVGG